MTPDKYSRRLDEVRPEGGWTTHAKILIRDRCPAAERRTKTRIERCQQYEGVHDAFSLAWIWFYYDTQDKVVDVSAESVD